MANLYGGIDLINGGLGALDKLDGAILNDKDGAIVITESSVYAFHLDDDSGVAEDSPKVISPNDNPGTKRWVLTGGVFTNLTVYGAATIADTLAVEGNITISKDVPVLLLEDTQVDGETWSIRTGAPAAGDFKIRGHSTDVFMITGTIAANSLVINDGNVGIGTPTPTELLEVMGASGDGVTPITLKLRTTSSIVWTEDSEFARVDFVSDDLSGDWVADETRARIAAVAENITGTYTGLAFYTSDTDTILTEQVRINHAGKMGINDVDPASFLDVNGDVNTTDVYKVDDVQVIQARVIDVRCDDAINTGDATSDGVIDSLRDAMITHGLIASA